MFFARECEMRGVQLVVPATLLQEATKSYTLIHIYSNDHVSHSSSAFSKYLRVSTSQNLVFSFLLL